MNYKIISSGSQGNCVIVNDVMVDCGVPFKTIKNHLYDIKYLLITHIHSDHVRITTLKSIKKLFPKITIIGNYEVFQEYGVSIIANAGFEIETKDYTFIPFECVHDVLCYGYTWNWNGIDIIYATDTNTLEHAPKKKYDYFFIESNHDEKKLETIAGQYATRGYDPIKNAKRHLSTQDAKAFYYLNRKSKDSEFIQLHKSSRFY